MIHLLANLSWKCSASVLSEALSLLITRPWPVLGFDDCLLKLSMLSCSFWMVLIISLFFFSLSPS